MERQKLELEINSPTKIKLLFDEPIVGESQYGKYYLYAVSNGSDKEYSLFAADAVHEVLKDHGKGTEAIITKLAAQRGKKLVTTFDVQIVGNGKVNGEVGNADQHKQNPKDDDFYYYAMEKSLDEAFRLTQKFNGLSISQIGISIFIQRTKNNGFTT